MAIHRGEERLKVVLVIHLSLAGGKKNLCEAGIRKARRGKVGSGGRDRTADLGVMNPTL